MSLRLKILLSVFAVGLIACVVVMYCTDAGAAWRASLAREDKKAEQAKAVAARRAAARSATRPTSRPKWVTVEATTLLRELPRQAMLITAADDFGLAARDRSVDFAGVAPDAPLECESNYKWGTRQPKVIVRDAKGAEVAAIDFQIPTIGEHNIDYAKLAAQIEPWCETRFVPLLAAATGKPAKAAAAKSPPARDDVPDGVDKLLLQVDPERAFLAAHLLHQAVAESGESPERLAALVRAYSNLGESTRYLYSPHTSAFFARALIYAERLARKHPELALSHAARGYAYTLLGQNADGRAAFARARELAGKDSKLPKWAELADDLNHFRTRRLFDETDEGKPAAALASYFMLLTVEHTHLQSIVINAARLALEHDPAALRVINIMNDNSGVGLQHETTQEQTTTQFKMLADLADQPGVPPEVKAAATRCAGANFVAGGVLSLQEAMDKEKPAPGQLLPWGAFASVSRDALFASALRRVYFTAKMFGVDPSERLAAWWPYVKDHRFAPVLAGFDQSGKLGSKEAAEQANNINHNEFARRLPYLKTSAQLLNPELKKGLGNYDYTDDKTGYDLANELWAYAAYPNIPLVALGKIDIAESLAQICPDHPTALAELIENRWPETSKRAAQIEKDFGGHPQVAKALARAYISEKRYEDAARLLEHVLALAPDRGAYAELAELYRQQYGKDDERWLGVYEKYLASTEDFGLDHANVNQYIAYQFLQDKKPERALKYARAAADSYSSWGLEVYSVCLTELGRFDEADQIQQAIQERYTPSVMWYRWCRMTGRGRLAMARAVALSSLAKYEEKENFNDVAVFYALEGDEKRAREYFIKAAKSERGPYPSLELALRYIEGGQLEDARLALEDLNYGELPGMDFIPKKLAGSLSKGSTRPTADQRRGAVYRAAVKEFQRCIDNPTRTPARGGDDLQVILDANGTSYRGSMSYVLGRLCELRGKTDDAIFWYQASMDCGDWNHSARPLAALALKRLGKPYYK
jgi:tetratricopeptide (TPR) repeat protein